MSDLQKASQDAVDAARQGDTYAVVLAALHAQQQAQQPACQHQAPPPVQPSGSAGKWIGIGIGGSFLAVSLAVSAVAFAIGAVALTVCVVVLRSVWTDYQKNR